MLSLQFSFLDTSSILSNKAWILTLALLVVLTVEKTVTAIRGP